MKKRMISILFAACLAINCFSVARANGSATDQNVRPELPHNLILSREARQLLEKVWRRSPTFRLQCARISQAHWLKIKFSWVELIGHEFEHVLEQIEEVNLAALAAEKSGQAQRHDDGAFETARALDAGRRVKAEYRRAKSADDAAEERSLLTTIRE
jgi:hypothetical protein